ncbi:unnamed protein product, partial [Bubo scandiacus]
MASLYQRFSGKINTSRSFPVPPEASHLLGAQSSEEDGAAGKTSRPLQQESSRPRFQYQPRSDCEEEDVSAGVLRAGLGWGLGVPLCRPPRPDGCLGAPLGWRRFLAVCPLFQAGLCASLVSPEVPGIVRDGARREPGLARPRAAPPPLLRYLASCAALRCRGAGLGAAGSVLLETASASSGCLPPCEATRLPPLHPPPPLFFFL